MSDRDLDQEEGESDGEDLLDESGEPRDPLGLERRRLPDLPAVKMRAAPAESRSGDLLAHYLSEIRRYALLDPEEERKVALQFYEQGDTKAAERLVTANLRLVIKIAFQYHRHWASVLDLIQEGNVGLVEALSRYDPYRGIRFSSYAQYWIRAMILRFLMDNFRLVRLGSTRSGRKLFFQLQKERDRLLREGKAATPRAIAERVGVPESEVNAVDQHLRAPAFSIDAPVGGEEGRQFSDIIADPEGATPEQAVGETQLSEIVTGKLDAFGASLQDERERAIWELRMRGDDPASLSDLGDRFQVSKERIRQIEARLKTRLKDFLRRELGEEMELEFRASE